jgi:hypothetical protein
LLKLDDDRGCYTVFSSADYRGAGNEGAVIILSSNGVNPESFHPDDIIKDEMLKIDVDPHCHHKYSKDVIRAIFKALDVDNHGYLTINDLTTGLNHTKQFKVKLVNKNLKVVCGGTLEQATEKKIFSFTFNLSNESLNYSVNKYSLISLIYYYYFFLEKKYK